MDTPKQSVAAESKLHFLDYWRIIRIRKVIIIAVFLLVVITTTAVTFVLQPSYQSTVQMRIERDTPDINIYGGSSAPQYDYFYLNTEFEVLKSEKILAPVINKLDLVDKYSEHYKLTPKMTMQDAYEQLVRDLDIKPERNTSLINISALAWDKNLAADIANEVAKEYERYRNNSRTDRYGRGLGTLTNQVEELKAKIERYSTNLDSLAKELEVWDLDPDSGRYQSLTAAELAQLRTVVNQYKTKITEEEAELKRLTNMPSADLVHALNSSHATPHLQKLLDELSFTQVRQVALRAELGPNHPDLKKVTDSLALLQEQTDAEVKGILVSLDNTVNSHRQVMEKLNKRLIELRDEETKVNAKSRPYMKAKKDLENAQQTYRMMMVQLTEEHVNAQISRDSSVEIVNKAKPGNKPVKPNKILNIALGSLAGILLGVGLAFFIEYLDTSVKTIDDVEQALGSPVLGVIPQNVGSLVTEGPESPHAEAYRVLRTNVLFSRKDPNFRTLTVVSGGAGEGKSTTIFNLAVVFAQQGSRVLLVDSDLRRPSLHKLFNVANTMGLTSYLLKQQKLEDVVQTTAVPTLHFLPSGKLPSSSMGILNSTAMKAFIDEAKSRYDFVFFDSPPIMGVSDASILASEVDMAILVVQYRKYPQQMTLRAKQMVEKVGGRMLGVVLNNINISQDSYYYYYSGYYYDYYSKSDDSKPASELKGGDKKEGRGGKSAPVVKEKF
jgi:polysaccharide biosynthesis transport protein